MDNYISISVKTEFMITARFVNEITLSIKNGYENNVKMIRNCLVRLSSDSIVILPQKDVPNQIIVPMTNIANYWVEE